MGANKTKQPAPRKPRSGASEAANAGWTAWRICRGLHADQPLSGTGGLYASGRWHHRGRRIVYSADSPALAALETLVHVGPRTAPRDLVLISLHVPGRVQQEELSRTDLNRIEPTWRETPAPLTLRDLGDQWLASGNSLVLRVPSVLVPAGTNFLLNPEHDQSDQLEVLSIEPFNFDPRLLPEG